MSSVLLTNAQLRKTLASVRSLGKKGATVIAADETRCNPSGFSKYCRHSLVYPNPRRYPEGFYEWLVCTIEQYKCDALFPMDDDTMEIAIDNREELQKLCKLPLPPTDSYAIASDKASTAILAMESGIDCPKTVVPSESLENLHELASQLQYPLVVKPRKSSGSRGIRIVHEKGRLEDTYMDIHEKYPYPIIQEYIGIGDRYDVCLLFDSESKLKASFVQKELRHFPVDMGPSTVQESIWAPELIQKSLSLMESLKWCGVVELEFMVDSRDGKAKLMEINPRFWNSLHLSVISGVDFPWLLYCTAMQKDFGGVFEYSTGIKCKWTLPGDILHFIASKERFKMSPPLLSGSRQGVFDDIISLHDPLPTLGFLLACSRYMFDAGKWRFLFRR
jgi:predicted ATP-grasp superfamily ATP-dependent carboligase